MNGITESSRGQEFELFKLFLRGYLSCLPRPRIKSASNLPTYRYPRGRRGRLPLPIQLGGGEELFPQVGHHRDRSTPVTDLGADGLGEVSLARL